MAKYKYTMLNLQPLWIVNTICIKNNTGVANYIARKYSIRSAKIFSPQQIKAI